MSLISHSFFPRRFMDLDSWMRPMTPVQDMKQLNKPDYYLKPTDFDSTLAPTTLDMFDAFDELDTVMNNDIDWLHKPDFLPLQPRVQQKVKKKHNELSKFYQRNFIFLLLLLVPYYC